MSTAHILPDRLAPDLTVWFVGTAAGPKSAATRTYYAHPGNRFWRALNEARVTPQLYSPAQYPMLLQHRIGLTDFCKTHWGVDASIEHEQFDIAGFRRKVVRLKPKSLAFTSKKAASLWLNCPPSRIDYGQQPAQEKPTVFVLPSPSGLATAYWSIEPWLELGVWMRKNTAPLRKEATLTVQRAK
jgi:TDG/mug DNA glycosylase family protein